MFDRLEFEENYNNKLNCNSFMVVDLHNPIRYPVGTVRHIYLKGVYKGDARILTSKVIRFSHLNPFITKLATGKDVDETIRIVKNKNKNKWIDWNKADICIVLFEYIKESREPKLFQDE